MSAQTPTYEECKQAHYKKRGERVRAAMLENARAGRPPGPLPLGYVTRRSPEGASVEIDENVAAHIRKAFELAAGDMPMRKILKVVSDEGLRSRSGKTLGISALWYLLTQPFYAGFVRYKSKLMPGRHSAIVNEEEFKEAQDGLFRRKKLLDKVAIRRATSEPTYS